MRIVIPTSAKREMICVPGAIYVTDDMEGKRRLHKRGHDLVACSSTRGIAEKREWISQNMIQDGQWYLSIDDDAVLVCVDDEFYSREFIAFADEDYSSSEWREVFRQPLAPEMFHDLALEISEQCVEQGTIYGGIMSQFKENYFFRGRKWNYWALTGACFQVIKNDRSLHFTPYEVLEDMFFMLQVLRKYGSVVINQWVFPSMLSGTPGGVDPSHNHVEWSNKLKAAFPDLIEPYKEHPWYTKLKRRGLSTSASRNSSG